MWQFNRFSAEKGKLTLTKVVMQCRLIFSRIGTLRDVFYHSFTSIELLKNLECLLFVSLNRTQEFWASDSVKPLKTSKLFFTVLKKMDSFICCDTFLNCSFL